MDVGFVTGKYYMDVCVNERLVVYGCDDVMRR